MSSIDTSTYEILQNRINTQKALLEQDLIKLNTARKQVFGAINLALIGNERVTTPHACIARDMVDIGKYMLLGYNLPKDVKISDIHDIFSTYKFDGTEFHLTSNDLLNDPKFLKEFKELYTFFSSTTFLQFLSSPTQLKLIFQTGKNTQEVRVFEFDITPESKLLYKGFNSSVSFQPTVQYAWNWTALTRDNHKQLPLPHIGFNDLRFFIKDKNLHITTKDISLISETVNNRDQTLDDLKVEYIEVNDIVLLQVTPFREDARFYIFNVKTKLLERNDKIAQSIAVLPKDQGIIFPNGVYLQDGVKHLIQSTSDIELRFLHVTPSLNKEEYLYVFYNESVGQYLLLRYNTIDRTLDTPIHCHGFCIYDTGTMVLFNSSSATPVNSHSVQIWSTPFYSTAFEPVVDKTSYLSKVGNVELVEGISTAYLLLKLLKNATLTPTLFNDIIVAARTLIDNYRWLSHPTIALESSIRSIKTACISALSEYDKVAEQEATASKLLDELSTKYARLNELVLGLSAKSILDFSTLISSAKVLAGEIEAAKSTKYVKVEKLNALSALTVTLANKLAHQCLEFLAKPESLVVITDVNSKILLDLAKVTKVIEITPLESDGANLNNEIDTLINTVNGLENPDTTLLASLIDRLTSVLTDVNQTRAKIKSLKETLGLQESKIEFESQFKLLTQSGNNYLTLAEDLTKLDELQGRLNLQFEDLESKFAQFDSYLTIIHGKKEELMSAFESKRTSLVELKNKSIETLFRAGERVLSSIANKAKVFNTLPDLNAFFVTDPMVFKVQEVSNKLTKMGDSVKAEDLKASLLRLQNQTTRTLKDKIDLFTDGAVNLGGYLFSVNDRPFELVLISKDSKLFYHITGTDYYEALTADIGKYKQFLTQSLPSETLTISRAEFLAYQAFVSISANPSDSIHHNEATINQILATSYDCGYSKGIHDHDAKRILIAAVEAFQNNAFSSFTTAINGLSSALWSSLPPQLQNQVTQEVLLTKSVLPPTSCAVGHSIFHNIKANLRSTLQSSVVSATQLSLAIDCIITNIITYSEYKHRISKQSLNYIQAFNSLPNATAILTHTKESTSALKSILSQLISTTDEDCFNEVFFALTTFKNPIQVLNSNSIEVTDLLSEHANISNGKLNFVPSIWWNNCTAYCNEQLPLYKEFLQLKHTLLETKRTALKLEQFKPQIFSGFIRNRLISKSYLPLIGANLAKQIGVAGANKRTDLSGLLLLISPPGYGKTTLIEYVANRLGLALIKVNGPAIGHEVTSLDPNAAPNATAKEELIKLNLSFEMGTNIMLYLDDIQHLNPEFLQKFISLCDGQRKIEGVHNGITKTYDFRGKKVAVVMAGNPYTETGSKFKIPDMLSNRADVYNLGDIKSNNSDAFEISFIENSLTSNTCLKRISQQNPDDLHVFLDRINKQEGSQLQGIYSETESQEITDVLGKLKTALSILLQVNSLYISSAAQEDSYRVEPMFKLQGSYRNMNRIAEKLSPVMTHDEVMQTIIGAYYNESQTLTQGAEFNFLRFKELINTLTATEQLRLTEIRKEFLKRNALGGADTDQVGKLILQLANLTENVGGIKTAINAKVLPLPDASKTLEVINAAELADASRDKAVLTQLAEQRALVTQLCNTLNGYLSDKQPIDVERLIYKLEASNQPDLLRILREILQPK